MAIWNTTTPDPALEQLARAYLYTYLHSFAEWPKDEFQAAIARDGSAVARHQADHLGDPAGFSDPDRFPEHCHEHQAGDPLRTWPASKPSVPIVCVSCEQVVTDGNDPEAAFDLAAHDCELRPEGGERP